VSFSYAFYVGIPFLLGGVAYVILAAFLGVRRDMNVERFDGIMAFVMSFILGISLPILFAKYGGWWLGSFVDNAAKILSPTFGEWYKNGFPWLVGIVAAIFAGLRVRTVNRGIWLKLGYAAMTVTVGTLAISILGALIIHIPFSFLSVTIPPFVLDSIVSIGLAAAGIVIPFLLGIFVVAYAPDVVDGTINALKGGRSDPILFIARIFVIIGVGMFMTAPLWGFWKSTVTVLFFPLGIVISIVSVLVVRHRRKRVAKVHERDSYPTKSSPPPPPPAICPECGGQLTFIKQYQRFYCQKCKKYS
jgi:hypothetical protein